MLQKLTGIGHRLTDYKVFISAVQTQSDSASASNQIIATDKSPVKSDYFEIQLKLTWVSMPKRWLWRLFVKYIRACWYNNVRQYQNWTKDHF